MADLPESWRQAIDRIARARFSPIHMPAALLVGLDLLEAGDSADGSIEFTLYEHRFKNLVKQVRPSAANSGWVPFYHLSTKTKVWNLYLGDDRADFSNLVGKQVSRSVVTKCADRARFRDELAPGLKSDITVRAITNAIYDLLRTDKGLDSSTLIRIHSATSSD